MKRLILIASSLLVATFISCQEQCGKVAGYVDPNIGGIAPLLTTVTPQVHRPNSMVRVFPRTYMSDRYLSDRIYGISLNMPRYRLGEVGSIMSTSGELKLDNYSLSSWYDHDIETLHPWIHKVHLQDFDIDASWTTTERSVIYRFSYNDWQQQASNIVLRVGAEGEITFLDDNTICGHESIEYAKQYFYAVLDHQFTEKGVISGSNSSTSLQVTGSNIGAWMSAKDLSSAEVRIGISYISVEQAKENLEAETANKTFDMVASEGNDIWEKALSKIRVKGGTGRERRIFYTSLYRNYERMVNQSEGDRYYSGFDRKVHQDERPFYNDDWIWDTYRTSHALGTILNPEQKSDHMQSYTRMYEQWGWVPNFPELTEWSRVVTTSGDTIVSEPMVGNHVSVLLAEAIKKGVTDFDIKKLYEGLRKNSLEGTMVPWRAGAAFELDHFYNENGYFPALYPGEDEPEEYVDHNWERRQAVSVTLEHSYDDWCLAQVAKELGYKEDYELFMKRSEYYLNLWNPEIGYFAPKDADGEWITPFDPQLCDGFGARSYFAEVNACVHAFHVQHNLPKLIELMGGNEAFIRRIDDVFNEVPKIAKWQFMGMMPDATGLYGMIPAGNEPSFHIPYLYNYAGKPWKTQYRVRQIADLWFDDDPSGLSGDEDGGALCAWYVFSAMGFYPVNPADGEYAISSPIFEEVTISLQGGREFKIEAKGASKRNKYIQSATLNGKPYNRPFISHTDIVEGGILSVVMGDRPSSWGE